MIGNQLRYKKYILYTHTDIGSIMYDVYNYNGLFSYLLYYIVQDVCYIFVIIHMK